MEKDKSLPTYTFTDIEDHDTADDLWLAVYDKVYNVTEFQSIHPGGKKVMQNMGGTNATEEFEDQGHDDHHLEEMEKHMIGNYDTKEDHLANKKAQKVIYSKQEVELHNNEKSNWLIIKGKVYDVTGFDHPGGVQLLLDYAGHDATEGFYPGPDDDGEGHVHSKDARKTLKGMQIGVLKQSGQNIGIILIILAIALVFFGYVSNIITFDL